MRNISENWVRTENLLYQWHLTDEIVPGLWHDGDQSLRLKIREPNLFGLSLLL